MRNLIEHSSNIFSLENYMHNYSFPTNIHVSRKFFFSFNNKNLWYLEESSSSLKSSLSMISSKINIQNKISKQYIEKLTWRVELTSHLDSNFPLIKPFGYKTFINHSFLRTLGIERSVKGLIYCWWNTTK